MRWKPCCALCLHSMHSGIAPVLLCIALATIACYAAYAYVPNTFGDALLFGAARDDAVVSAVVFSGAGAVALVCAAVVIVGLACCCCARNRYVVRSFVCSSFLFAHYSFVCTFKSIFCLNSCCTCCSERCSKHCGVCVRERHCSTHCGDMYKCRRLDVVASRIGNVGGFANIEHVLALHAARELIAGLRLIADYGTLRDAGEEWREPASRCCTRGALRAGGHPGVHDTSVSSSLRGDRRFDRALSCLEIALWPCLQCKPSVALAWEQRCIACCKPRNARNAALRAQLVRASGAVADALLSDDDWLPLPNGVRKSSRVASFIQFRQRGLGAQLRAACLPDVVHCEGAPAKVAAKCSLSHFVEIPAHVNKLDHAFLPRLSAARDWEDPHAYRRGRSTLHGSADDGVSFHLPQLNPKSLGAEDAEAVKRSERNSMARCTEYIACNAARLDDYLIAPDAVAVSFLLFTVTFYVNSAHNLTRSP